MAKIFSRQWWVRFGVDEALRWSAIKALGWVLSAAGSVWLILWRFIENAPVAPKLMVVFGLAILAVALGREALKEVRERRRMKRDFPVVLVPVVIDNGVQLAVSNRGARDEFKVSLVSSAPIFSRGQLPLVLKWKGVPTEYREIPKDGTEVVQLLSYVITGPPPVPFLKIQLHTQSEGAIEGSDSLGIFFEPASPPKTTIPLSFVVIGRNTAPKVFTVYLTASWYDDGFFESQLLADVSPFPLPEGFKAGVSFSRTRRLATPSASDTEGHPA